MCYWTQVFETGVAYLLEFSGNPELELVAHMLLQISPMKCLAARGNSESTVTKNSYLPKIDLRYSATLDRSMS